MGLACRDNFVSLFELQFYFFVKMKCLKFEN